jgi:hypothetical protein
MELLRITLSLLVWPEAEITIAKSRKKAEKGILNDTEGTLA